MSTRTWSVLSWNVRGINSDKKWGAVKDRVLNSLLRISVPHLLMVLNLNPLIVLEKDLS